MHASAPFGKRRRADEYAASVRTRARYTAPPPVPDFIYDPPFSISDYRRPISPVVLAQTPPVLSFVITAILFAIFWAELNFSVRLDAPMTPDPLSLVSFGGVQGQFVFQNNEWWRIFTAPLLHGSITHILGNAVALMFAGMVLEPLIGARWFGAVFALSALAGVAGSLAQNNPGIVSVGASGAITGLLACSFICSFRHEDAKSRTRMQKIAKRFLLPALIPALLPSAATSGGGVDYGAHFAGALAGMSMGFFLQMIWSENRAKPGLRGIAFALATTFSIFAVFAFAQAAQTREESIALMQAQLAAQPQPIQVNLIPRADVPTTRAEMVKHSRDLVERYPDDPRAHLFRAGFYLDKHDLADAETQLRIANEQQDALGEQLSPKFRHGTKMLLALVLRAKGQTRSARNVARESCAEEGEVLTSLRQTLQKEGICE